MTRKTVTLIANRVEYGSYNDEAAFFEWLDKIRGVLSYDGEGDALYIHVNSRLNEATLRDFLALFDRYGVDMKQLAVFDSDKFSPWFRDKNSYWYKSVFGNKAVKANPNKKVQKLKRDK